MKRKLTMSALVASALLYGSIAAADTKILPGSVCTFDSASNLTPPSGVEDNVFWIQDAGILYVTGSAEVSCPIVREVTSDTDGPSYVYINGWDENASALVECTLYSRNAYNTVTYSDWNANGPASNKGTYSLYLSTGAGFNGGTYHVECSLNNASISRVYWNE